MASPSFGSLPQRPSLGCGAQPKVHGFTKSERRRLSWTCPVLATGSAIGPSVAMYFSTSFTATLPMSCTGPVIAPRKPVVNTLVGVSLAPLHAPRRSASLVRSRSLAAAAVASLSTVGRAVLRARDPGRLEVAGEYLDEKGGEEILRLRMSSRSSATVRSYKASESQKKTRTEQWRVLRFENSARLVQGVSRVVFDKKQARMVQRSDVLPLQYTKSYVATVLATLQVLGAPVLPLEADGGRRLRLLCIGLGSGSMPTFLAAVLPHCHVDVVELEEVIIRAAREGMGFQEHSRLVVHQGDGAEFARSAAEALKNANAGDPYDAVLIDAYDDRGEVPEVFRSSRGPFADALRSGLVHPDTGLVAVNLLPRFNAESVLRAHREALCLERRGICFSVRSHGLFPDEGEALSNYIAVQTLSSGTDMSVTSLRQKLRAAGEEITRVTRSFFDMGRLSTRYLREW